MDADAEYEAQRQANIAANFLLLQSLGLSSQRAAKKSAVRRRQPTSTWDSLQPRKQPDRRARPKRPKVGSSKGKGIGKTQNKQVSTSPARSSDVVRRTSGRTRKAKVHYGEEPTKSSLRSATSSFLVDDSEGEDDNEAEYVYRGKRAEGESSSLLLRTAQRLGARRHDPKQFGSIAGIPVGTWWPTRMDCSTDAVHAPTVAGISGNNHVGCYSLALSGGYDEDVDLGDSFTYTGSGGRKLQGVVNGKRINLRTAPQTFDQSFGDSLNGALRKSSQTGKPVRVIRGYKGDSVWSPEQGYIYSGLYVCTRAWMAKGTTGFKVCRYAFQRLPGQDPLPIPDSTSDSNTDYHIPTSGQGRSSSSEAESQLDSTLELPRLYPNITKGWTVEVVVTRRESQGRAT